jgi:GTPase SAR1 family protein
VDEIRSFDETEYWFNTVANYLDDRQVALFLVGNKTNLGSARQVWRQAGMDKAESWRVAFFETSALTSINIRELFQEVAHQVLTTSPTDKPAPGPKPKPHLCCIRD